MKKYTGEYLFSDVFRVKARINQLYLWKKNQGVL